LTPAPTRDNTADSFGAHDGRQPWPIAIAAGDHQKIVLVDRRALERHHDFAGRRLADVGNIDGFDDLSRISKTLDLECFHAKSPSLSSMALTAAAGGEGNGRRLGTGNLALAAP
jgi:hypothetical protein